jgi:hypothetical protein
MAKEKKSSGAVCLAETGIDAQDKCLDRPDKNNIHAEEVVVVNSPQPTPGTIFEEAAPDARNKSHESTTSYEETWRSQHRGPFANNYL